MKEKTLALWEKQDQHKGDRWRLFKAVSQVISANKVLYPGCYVDIAPSFVFDDVTYADVDKRAAQFFEDDEGVKHIIGNHDRPSNTSVQFMHADYNKLALKPQSFDLLISLYAGFISEPCGDFLRIGGMLLVNASHGDVALAALDTRFKLVGVVNSAKGEYKVSDKNLDDFMVPKKPQTITREFVLKSGRAIAYTKTPFAYLFQRIV